MGGCNRTWFGASTGGPSTGLGSPSANLPAVESFADYFTLLASDAPAPGGGSAATIVAAAGASLVAMVARISSTSAKYASYHELASKLVMRADLLRHEFLHARVRDEAAFANVVTAQALPKSTDAEKSARAQELENALQHAAEEPLESARLALEVLHLSARALEIPNKNLVSDVGCAAEFASAAINACAYNVRINHRFMKNKGAIAKQEDALAGYEREAHALLESVRRGVTAMMAP